MIRLPSYSVVLVTDHWILIVDNDDRDDAPSVTNGAQTVLDELAKTWDLKHRKVIYRDSSGVQIDRILHENGQHSGFAPLSEAEAAFYRTALAAVPEQTNWSEKP